MVSVFIVTYRDWEHNLQVRWLANCPTKIKHSCFCTHTKMLFIRSLYLWVEEEWGCWMYHSCQPNHAGTAQDNHDQDPRPYPWSLPMGPIQRVLKLENRTELNLKNQTETNGSDAYLLVLYYLPVSLMRMKAEFPVQDETVQDNKFYVNKTLKQTSELWNWRATSRVSATNDLTGYSIDRQQLWPIISHCRGGACNKQKLFTNSCLTSSVMNIRKSALNTWCWSTLCSQL